MANISEVEKALKEIAESKMKVESFENLHN